MLINNPANHLIIATIFCSQAGKTRTKDKYRVVYTDQQRVELEKEFLFNKYITIRRKTEMATYLGLSERQVSLNAYHFQRHRLTLRNALNIYNVKANDT